MKHINGDKQMTDVWRLPAIAKWEKSCGKHPTQKPLCVLSRIIMASTKPGAWILDPFLGIEREEEFVAMSKSRREEIERLDVFEKYRKKIADIMKAGDLQIDWFGLHEPEPIEDLPFLL